MVADKICDILFRSKMRDTYAKKRLKKLAIPATAITVPRKIEERPTVRCCSKREGWGLPDISSQSTRNEETQRKQTANVRYCTGEICNHAYRSVLFRNSLLLTNTLEEIWDNFERFLETRLLVIPKSPSPIPTTPEQPLFSLQTSSVRPTSSGTSWECLFYKDW